MRFERLLTDKNQDAYQDIPFTTLPLDANDPDEELPEQAALIEVPASWPRRSIVSLFRHGLGPCLRASELRITEENTVPSWIWRHHPKAPEESRPVSEHSARQVFDRFAGALTYEAWQQGSFNREADARIFYDELRAILALQMACPSLKLLHGFGIGWAYGLDESDLPLESGGFTAPNLINAEAERLWSLGGALSQRADLYFTINPMAMRRDDGQINSPLLQHVTRICSFALHVLNAEERYNAALTCTNLGALLMAQAIPYNSEQSRHYAASLMAVISATAAGVSMQLAHEKGPGKAFNAQRDAVLELIQLKADIIAGEDVFDDRATPIAAVRADKCPDLGLLADARKLWAELAATVSKKGLRSLYHSGIFPTPREDEWLAAESHGLQPVTAQMALTQSLSGTFQRQLTPAVLEGLSRLGLDPDDVARLQRHAEGYHSLQNAPAINPTALALWGVDAPALARLEAALAVAFTLRQAFTPWVLGEEFCQKKIGLNADALRAPGFDLLTHMGFSADDIARAGGYVCGHQTVFGMGLLTDEQKPIFMTARPNGDDIRQLPTEAEISLLAAAQPFIMGPLEENLLLPADSSAAELAGLYANIQQMGLRRINWLLDPSWLRTETAPEAETEKSAAISEEAVIVSVPLPAPLPRQTRHKLPERRKGYTQRAVIGGHKVYLRTGEYDDGRLGEIFIDMHKEGAAFRSLMNNFAIAISIGLQYGVPLEEFVEAFSFTRFEPSGIVEGNDSIKMATSTLDYIFRELAISYLGREDLAQAQRHDLTPDTLGRGHREGDLPSEGNEASAEAITMLRKVTSKGYVRSRFLKKTE